MSANSIDSDSYVDGSIDTAHIANDQITNALMADDAVGVAQLSATGTASSSTFLRGDNAWAAAGGGKVLQVVTAIDSGSWSSSSTSFQDTNLSVTITPNSTSNKILILGSVTYSNNLSSSNNGLRLVRGSTDLTGHQIYSLTIDGAGSYQRGVWGWHHLDSPSTTSATTYKVQAGHNTNGNSISLHAANDSITVLEIEG
jgi:hypothetical protein